MRRERRTSEHMSTCGMDVTDVTDVTDKEERAHEHLRNVRAIRYIGRHLGTCQPSSGPGLTRRPDCYTTVTRLLRDCYMTATRLLHDCYVPVTCLCTCWCCGSDASSEMTGDLNATERACVMCSKRTSGFAAHAGIAASGVLISSRARSTARRATCCGWVVTGGL